jgi:peptidyl-prolyl cis-trans isomerase D
MFDLFRSRAKAVRYLLGAVLVVVAIMMVLTLIPGVGTPTAPNAQVVAEVDGEPLSLIEVQRTVQSQIQAQSFPASMASVFVPQIADRMIMEYAMAYQSKRMGFEVTDSDVAAAIRQLLPQLFEDGKFAGREAYAAMLAQRQTTIEHFESMLRKQLLIEKLQSLLMEGVVVSNAEVEAEYRRKNEGVKIEYISVDSTKLFSQVSVSPEEIKAYYEANRASYQMPETRSARILLIDYGPVSRSIEVPDSELRAAYERQKDSYRTPERVRVRHILLKTTDKTQEEVSKIRTRAEGLLKQVKQGADFADLAKKNSDDPGSASKGGDLDWVTRGQTVPAFEQAAFSLKPKEISNLITTEYGFHIIQVMEKQEARLQPFEEVRSQLLEEVRKQRVIDTMESLADQARAALVKDPSSAEKIAQSMNLLLVRADKLAAGEPFPVLGTAPDLSEAISSLRKNEVAPVVQISTDRLAIAVVTDVFPARPAELPDVEGKIRGTLGTEKLNQLVERRAKEAYEKVTAMGGDLKKAAQALGLEWKNPPAFGLEGNVEGLGTADYVKEAFTKPVGTVFGPITVNDRRFICKVTEKIPADMAKLEPRRADLTEQIKGARAQERMELFQKSLRDQLIKDGKLKINQDVIDRLAASYRGSTT